MMRRYAAVRIEEVWRHQQAFSGPTTAPGSGARLPSAMVAALGAIARISGERKERKLRHRRGGHERK